MKLDDLTLGEAREIASLLGSKSGKCVADGGVKIVVLQRGWVAVGRYSQSGNDCRLDDAAIIRTWGTSKGLTELVKGPVEGKTVLDKSSLPIRFHELTVVLTLDCEESGWKKYL
jgi:hypothetical protein